MVFLRVAGEGNGNAGDFDGRPPAASATVLPASVHVVQPASPLRPAAAPLAVSLALVREHDAPGAADASPPRARPEGRNRSFSVALA